MLLGLGAQGPAHRKIVDPDTYRAEVEKCVADDNFDPYQLHPPRLMTNIPILIIKN